MTCFSRLALARSGETDKITMETPPPLFCVMAQGRKRISLGSDEFFYDPSTYLITSADLPVTAQVVEAPYLGLSLALDPGILADILADMAPLSGDRAASKAMAVSVLEGELLEALLRLLRLLDEPQHVAMLAPLIEREILYRLLLGPKSEMLRQLALPTSQLSQINRTISFIRQRYDQPIRVEELSQLASMSPPSFHRHFRVVTGMSPLQFQKRIRLQEARRRLLSENEGAASVAFDVGYESPSQFSREYRRLFGAPPARDATLARRELAASG